MNNTEKRHGLAGQLHRTAATTLVGGIRLYQRLISPFTRAHCRHHPTCSEYAITALKTRGLVVGSTLTIWRLLRCQPFGTFGYDPVPEGRKNNKPTKP